MERIQSYPHWCIEEYEDETKTTMKHRRFYKGNKEVRVDYPWMIPSVLNTGPPLKHKKTKYAAFWKPLTLYKIDPENPPDDCEPYYKIVTISPPTTPTPPRTPTPQTSLTEMQQLLSLVQVLADTMTNTTTTITITTKPNS